MKPLINPSILNKFTNTLDEKMLKSKWELLKKYQQSQEIVKQLKETELQSEFVEIIFGKILGYSSRSTNLENPDIIVEKLINGKKADAVILHNKKPKVVIELKSKNKNLFKASKNQSGGLHGLAPIHQCALYHFMFETTDLAIVSNYNEVVIFNNKQNYYQYYSLFDMSYDEFKEFYLILSKDSLFNGLSMLMIKESDISEKIIDEEFFTKLFVLYRQLNNILPHANATDLFYKFLALAIIEDSGLENKLINLIQSRKDDFTHSCKSHWDIWVRFFKSIKSNKNSNKQLGISDKISNMQIWKKTNYLEDVKLPKSILDMVVEISKYDLLSMKMDELFFNISLKILNPYDYITPEKTTLMNFYKQIIENDMTAGDLPTSFLTLDTSIKHPLIDLYNELNKRISYTTDKSTQAIILQDNVQVLITNTDNLLDLDYVKKIKQEASKVEWGYIDDDAYIKIFFEKKLDNQFIELQYYQDKPYFYPRKHILNKLNIYSETEIEWLNNYKKDAISILDYAVINSSSPNLVYDIDQQKIYNIDEFNDIFASENIVFLESDNPTKLRLIMLSPDFINYIRLGDFTSDNFDQVDLSLRIIDDKYIISMKKYIEIKEDIILLKDQLIRSKSRNESLIKQATIENQIEDLFYSLEDLQLNLCVLDSFQ